VLNRNPAVSLQYLTELVYELLDAHGDTMSLAAELLDDPVWAAHVNYLQGLQRVGREALAHTEAVTDTEALPPTELAPTEPVAHTETLAHTEALTHTEQHPHTALPAQPATPARRRAA
jgi:hypothetical protein